MKKLYLAVALFFLSVLVSYSQVWQPVGNGVNGRVTSFTKFNGNLVAGGAFSEAGGAPAEKVAQWDGSNWMALGTAGIQTEITALAAVNNELFAGYPWPANPIIKWDGTNWVSVSNSLSTPIYSLTEYNSQLIGGIMYNFSGYELMSWDGNNWNVVGPGGEFINGSVKSLLNVNNELYMAGDFESLSLNTDGIIKWDGTSWSAVGIGMDHIKVLAEYNGEIYAGGNFTTVTGAPADYIAKWDGNSWSAVGSGVNNTVFALKVINNELYAGGSFTLAGGNNAEGVAKWNGTNWISVGFGITGSVMAIEEFNNELYIGGDMSISGPGPTFFTHLAKMQLGVSIEETNTEPAIQILPVPSKGLVHISTHDAPAEITVTDAAGKIITRIKNTVNSKNTVHLKQPGLYFITVNTKTKIINRKIIIVD